MNDSRHAILLNLVQWTKSPSVCHRELMRYPWDRTEPLVEVRRVDVRNALHRALGNGVALRELEEWANCIEVRDDLSFQSGARDAVHVIANPALHGGLTRASIEHLIMTLSEPPPT